jgi:hypothetical protein
LGRFNSDRWKKSRQRTDATKRAIEYLSVRAIHCAEKDIEYVAPCALREYKEMKHIVYFIETGQERKRKDRVHT